MKIFITKAFLPFFLLIIIAGCTGQDFPISSMTYEELEARVSVDTKSILIYRKGIIKSLNYIREKNYSSLPEDALTPDCVKIDLLKTWSGIMDYYHGLDSITNFYSGFITLNKFGSRRLAFLPLYSAFLTSYRYAIDLINEMQHIPGTEIFLNENSAGIADLMPNFYEKFSNRFLNEKIASIYTALLGLNRLIYYINNDNKSSFETTHANIREDEDIINSLKGIDLTFKSREKLLLKFLRKIVLPGQTVIAEFMGDIKVKRKGNSLITPTQIKELNQKLQPGDLLFTRREWYLSNIGLPGFWPHGALFIGTGAERASYFDDPEVAAWVRRKGTMSGNFEDLLDNEFNKKYLRSHSITDDGNSPRVIEAVGEGVVLSSLEHTADADSLSALRPLRPKLTKAIAIYKAFYYLDRPYDFDFDFETDDKLVCTEFLSKVYSSDEDISGLKFPVSIFLGRKLTSATDIIRQFSEQYGTPEQQTEFITFLDGKEKTGIAVEASLDEFLKSFNRPKWHIYMQTDVSPKK